MMKRLGKKIGGSKGFTLAEVLVALLILLMVTSVVAMGVPLAANAYNKVTRAANAQVFLSTTVTRLRNELGTASDVTVSGTTVTYTSSNGSTSRIFVSSTGEPGIYLREYADLVSDNDNFQHLLVAKEASGSDMYSTYGGIAYAGGVVPVTDLRVISGSDTVAQIPSLQIRVLSYH